MGAVLRPAFGAFGLVSLRLHSSELLNHDTKKLRFQLPDPKAPSGLSLTSSILTISFPRGRWLPVLRPYTATNDLDELGHLELHVKRYPYGRQSTHLHLMQTGDSIYAVPIKGYTWTPNKHAHVAMIAGGAGITPMYQLLRGILKNPEDKTRMTLVWGVNTDADIFLGDEFASLQRAHPGRLEVHYVVSRPSQGSAHPSGHITRDILERAGLGLGMVKGDGAADTKVLVCGPPAMEKAVAGNRGWIPGAGKGVLQELGYASNKIHRF